MDPNVIHPFKPKLSLLLTILLSGCNSHWQPTADTTWQWQLEGDLDTSYQVDAYDIDLFDTQTSTIRQLQSSGKKVICYFSAGTFESWREDAPSLFHKELLVGKMEGWDEIWLNIKDKRVWEVMSKRLDLAVLKGCDAVEPDNVDLYINNKDFTYEDQLVYNRFLATEAHKRGLAVGLKNDLDQVEDLIDYFDFAVNEECLKYDECEVLTLFINHNKPVFHVEYPHAIEESEESQFPKPESMTSYLNSCRNLEQYGFQSLLMPLHLDDKYRIDCRELLTREINSNI
ncbi:endo alpha-1,4 polygalactosaminidase [Vibrio rotiferianus]|uniref:Endo alpha-1,4 polygalactosaminidase n=1 Tax=Vibrio rotiferianus TaxID=190895 RepID=A0ABX3D501_9VIBR|nr:endo alpha-1,4 polygalactosaminidase [Vibrio rotiferianus]OHY89615.1 endo alpha-1,4 polygalactosaminidase [Vibrio rotiferianus]